MSQQANHKNADTLLPIVDLVIKVLYSGLAFFTPLVMASFTSELFEFNKMMLIYTLALFVTSFWVLKMILLKKIIIKKTWLDIPILLFLLTQIVSTVGSIDPHTSIFGYYGRFNGGLLSIIAYIALYYGFVSNIMSHVFLEKLLKISLVSSAIVILWGLPGRLGYDLSCLIFTGHLNNSCWTDQFRPSERMFSTLGQPNWLGAYLAVHFFIGLYFFIKHLHTPAKLDFKKMLWGVYLCINFTSILFTRSRSTFFAVFLGLLFFGIYYVVKIKETLPKSNKRIMGAILLSFVVAILLFKTGIQQVDKWITMRTYIPSSHVSQAEPVKPQPVGGVSESGDIRKIVWKGAIELGKRYPLFGTGVETFAYGYYFTRPQEHNLTSEWDFLYNKAHNEYLNYFATTGFIGAGSYILLIVSIFVFAFLNLRREARFDTKLLSVCLMLSYVTILVTNFFGFSTTTVNLFFYLIPAFFVVLYTPIKNENQTLHTLDAKTWGMAGVLGITVCFMSMYLLRYYFADITYAKGDTFAKTNDYQKATEYLNTANSLKPDHVYEDRLSYVLANIAFIASYQKENELAEQMISTSDALNKKTIQDSPQNALYYKTRAKDFYLFYQITLDNKNLDEGIAALLEAQKLAPTDPKIPYSLAIFYSLKEDDTKDTVELAKLQEQSLREAQRVVELKPDYRDGYFLQGQLLKKAGKTEEARKAFEYILERLSPHDEETKKELESF